MTQENNPGSLPTVKEEAEFFEQFEYWLTNNMYINRSAATVIIDHVKRYFPASQPTGKQQGEESTLVKAAKELLHLHMCEQEGLSSGQPTSEMWLNAVDKLSEALSQSQPLEHTGEQEKEVQHQISITYNGVDEWVNCSKEAYAWHPTSEHKRIISKASPIEHTGVEEAAKKHAEKQWECVEENEALRFSKKGLVNLSSSDFADGAKWASEQPKSEVEELKKEIERLKGLIEMLWKYGELDGSYEQYKIENNL